MPVFAKVNGNSSIMGKRGQIYFGEVGAPINKSVPFLRRPWVLFGKSSSCFFFDPNFGEFSLKQTEGITLCLGAVAAAYGQKLSQSYRLWGFN